MNLVQERWLTFRLRDGSVKMMPMAAICDPDVVDFALPRADFQGAAYQFAIGLLQTVFAPEDANEWHDLYEEPPTETILQASFDKVSHAFNATGDGPLFMQDFDLLESAKPAIISGLLIDAPGGNGLKLNTDHFVKRGMCDVMSLEMAVLSLFTLQINAPSGGQGHRTGLRGGGPLTTLVMPQRLGSSLWEKLWLNVSDRENWDYVEPELNSVDVFPWLGSTKTSEEKDSEIFASNVHELHMYWAMPRRIRLLIEERNDVCDLSGAVSDRMVTEYRSQNYGCNYSGTWAHPLTPYKWNPKKPNEEHLSVKGQPGGITYKVWDTLVLTGATEKEGMRSAMPVSNFYSLSRGFSDIQSEVPRLWVFGYDMDNMKPRCWYSVTMPLFSLEPRQQEDILYRVKALQHLANDVLWQSRTQIKSAWFDKPGDVKGDTSFIDQAFWQRTEAEFFNTVHSLIDNMSTNQPFLSPAQAKSWLQTLRQAAENLFDGYAMSELGAERSMAKRIKARQKLTGWLYGSKPIKNFIKENNIDSLKEAS